MSDRGDVLAVIMHDERRHRLVGVDFGVFSTILFAFEKVDEFVFQWNALEVGGDSNSAAA